MTCYIALTVTRCKQNLNHTRSYLFDEKNKQPGFPVVILKYYKE